MSATSNNKRSATEAGLPEGDTNAPCCWVCLEEGPDKSGKPLVRDCSCRGSSGHAHLSCIIKNAESHGRRVAREDVDVNPGVFAKAFEFCPNCKQQYQNDVIYKLTKAVVEFTDREYKDVNCGYLLGMTLSNRLTVIDPKNNADDRVEGEESCTKIISIIDDMKRNESLAQVWKEMYIYSEAKAYGAVATFYMHVDTEESLTKAKLYYTKARDIFREKGDEIPMLMAEKKIAEIESKISGEENMCIDTHQKIYAYLQRTIGESDPQTIRAGADVAEALCLSFRAIEGERLLSKLVELSKRVHGMEHECTKRTTSYLQRMKERIVITQDGHPFIALRYENDGDACIVKDPTVDDETESKISASKIVPYLGTPVICTNLEEYLPEYVAGEKGLQQSTHLNGKIGDVRQVDLEKGTCQVYFEEAGLEHAEIKFNNLGIVFTLPPVGA